MARSEELIQARRRMLSRRMFEYDEYNRSSYVHALHDHQLKLARSDEGSEEYYKDSCATSASIATLFIVSINLNWGRGAGFVAGAGLEITEVVLPCVLSNPCGVGVSSPIEEGQIEQRSVRLLEK